MRVFLNGIGDFFVRGFEEQADAVLHAYGLNVQIDSESEDAEAD